jgi:integrase/recombinase XerD
MAFTGIRSPVELRLIARAHAIAWRKDLDARKLAPGSIRRKMSALSSLYEFLTDKNAVAANQVKGVKRPKVDSYEGKTPAIADKEARQLMNLPTEKTLKGFRDRAMLATLLYHGLRREELCRLRVKDIHSRRGVPHLRVHGKGSKTRYLPLHAGAHELLNDYLDEAHHAADTEGALFRPVSNNRTGYLIPHRRGLHAHRQARGRPEEFAKTQSLNSSGRQDDIVSDRANLWRSSIH